MYLISDPRIRQTHVRPLDILAKTAQVVQNH